MQDAELLVACSILHVLGTHLLLSKSAEFTYGLFECHVVRTLLLTNFGSVGAKERANARLRFGERLLRRRNRPDEYRFVEQRAHR